MEIKSRFKYAWRVLKSNRLSTVISVVGLGVGLACTMILVKYIHQEYTTDHFHGNYKRIYCCMSKSSEISYPEWSSIINWKKAIEDYPEVKCNTEFQLHPGGEIRKNKEQYKADVLAVDTNIAKVLDFEFLAGEMDMSDPGRMIVTEHFAKRIFGNKYPLGEEVEYWGTPYKITGVLRDWPINSSFTFDVLVPVRRVFSRMGVSFIVLNDGCDITTVNEKLGKEEFSGIQKFMYEYIPWDGFYFNSSVNQRSLSTMRKGNEKMLSLLGIIATVILVISVFNYVNMYNVVLLKRYKELGVKKVYGVGGNHLFAVFWTENMVMVSMAVFTALLLIVSFARIIETEIEVPIRLNMQFDTMLLAGILIFLPLLTSIWPFIRYCRTKPVLSVKADPAAFHFFSLRRLLLMGQYVMTAVLMIVSFYFIRQMDFMLHREIGINKDNILHAVFFDEVKNDYPMPGDSQEMAADKAKRYRELKERLEYNIQFVDNEIRNYPAIQNLCVASSPLDYYVHPWKSMEGQLDYRSCASISIAPGFEKLYGLKIKDGRFFDRERDEDRQNKVVVNEAALKFFDIKSIEDAYLANNYWGAEKAPWEIIGVVEDFHYEHLSKAVQPLVMFFFDDYEKTPYQMHITKGKEQEAIAFLQNLYAKVNPEGEFSWHFFEDDVKAQYAGDKKIVRIFSVFTLLAILISSMGLFGVAVFDTRQRYREIGIRKVNGATMGEVVRVLIARFFVLAGAAFVIACPIAWISVRTYMQNVAEKVDLSWWLFGSVALLLGCFVFLTLFWQSYKAAAMNPVDVLKNE